VSFNECTSLLQRGAEDMEYVDLLSIAVTKTTSVERCAYVAAFAASEYASTVNRVAKPFNPLLVFTFLTFLKVERNIRVRPTRQELQIHHRTSDASSSDRRCIRRLSPLGLLGRLSPLDYLTLGRTKRENQIHRNIV